MISDELYISVDVETSGPIPGEYSLLSIGACLVSDPSASIYLELQPKTAKYDPEALAASGLSLDQLHREGTPPLEAMHTFENWITSLCHPKQRVILLASTPLSIGLLLIIIFTNTSAEIHSDIQRLI